MIRIIGMVLKFCKLTYGIWRIFQVIKFNEIREQWLLDTEKLEEQKPYSFFSAKIFAVLKNGIPKHKYILSSYHCISVQRKQRMSTRYRGNIFGLARGVIFNGLQDEDGTNSEEDNTLPLVSAQTSAHLLLEDSERDAGKTGHFDNHYFKL